MRWGTSTLIGMVIVLSSNAMSASPATAEIFTVEPGDDVGGIEATVNSLEPGDELVLSGGMYTLDERFSFSLVGTANAPIVIRAAKGEVPHLHRPNDEQNIVDIVHAEHVIIRGIELSGGSAGIRISGAKSLTIEDCEVHDTGDVAIRANDAGVTYESLRILRNHVHHTNHTGEGMYLGCNNAGCEVVDGLIEGNYVHHTNQASVTQGDGIELKEGSSGNVIRDNVIHDTNYPCILTYASNGAPNVIERNVMWGCGDHGIQSAADAIIRNNIVLGAGVDGVAMQPHQSGSPSNLVVVHNTVLNAGGDAMSLRGISGSVTIANNALYASGGSAFFANGTSGLVFEGNAGVGGGTLPMIAGDIQIDFVDANFSGTLPINVFPAADGVLTNAGADAHVPEDDFNGTRRDGVADIGAYAASTAANPGWVLAPEPKGPPPAAGSVGGGAGSAGAGGEPSPGDEGGSSRTGGEPSEAASTNNSPGCHAAEASPFSTAGAWLVVLVLVIARHPRRNGRCRADS